MKYRVVLTLATIATLASAAAHALEDLANDSPVAEAVVPTVGFELNFTNAEIVKVWQKQTNRNEVNNVANEKYRDKMTALVKVSCRECQVVEFENSYGVKAYRVTYPDGWYFQVNTDPAMVEIQTAPITVDRLAADVGQRLERDVFNNARRLGLVVPQNAGFSNLAGGHIHFGITSSLGGSLLLMRNLFVDYVNHSEMASGIFVNDMLNAPSVSFLEQSQRDALAEIIADVDSGKIRSINSFAQRIRDEVYNKTPKGSEPPSKYQAFNVNRIGNLKQSSFKLAEQTFELRAFPAQDDSVKMFLEANLIRQRLLFLQTSGGRVPLNIPTAQQTPEQKVDAFYRYVSDTGLDFTPYKRFLKPPFNDWTKKAAAKYRESQTRTCQSLF